MMGMASPSLWPWLYMPVIAVWLTMLGCRECLRADVTVVYEHSVHGVNLGEVLLQLPILALTSHIGHATIVCMGSFGVVLSSCSWP
jgi:hypothetical protein